MIDYTSVEQAVLAALEPLNSATIESMLMPEVEIEYNQVFKKSRYTIAYHSSKYSEKIKSISEATQDEIVGILILIEALTLRKENGIYQMKALALDRLLGLKIPNFTPLIAQEFVQSERDAPAGGIFSWELIMRTTAISQQTSVDNYEEFSGLEYADELSQLNADYGGGDNPVLFPLQFPPDTA